MRSWHKIENAANSVNVNIYWIFDVRARNVYLFWWWYFDITSDFSNKWLLIFIQTKEIFLWFGVVRFKLFFLFMLPFGQYFLLSNSSTKQIISYHFYTYKCWMIFYGLESFFECFFTDSSAVFGFAIIAVALSCRYR